MASFVDHPGRGIRYLLLGGVFFLLATMSAPALSDDSGSSDKPYDRQIDVPVAQAHGVVIPMDVFTPNDNANGIGIIDVGSGGWNSDRGKVRDHERAQVYDIFCKRGYTMFAIRPGSVSRFSAHDMAEHLEKAIKNIQTDAERWGIDPDRMSITGASAGGHLASLVALRGNVNMVACGVFFPPTDFLSWHGKRVDPSKRGLISTMVRGLAYPDRTEELNEEEITEQLTAISPARLVSDNAPPFMIIHGDADFVVPLQQSERLVEELEAKDVPVELIVKKGGGHPWLTIHEEVAKMADWFDKHYAKAKVASSE